MLKAVITTLILASSTGAFADNPREGRHHDDRAYHQRHWDRNDRTEVTLAQGMSVGSSGLPRYIALDARFRPDRLRFDLRRGRAFIQRITLVYADGRRQTLRVDQPINRDRPSLAIDVDGAGLRGVLIDTRQRGYARGGGSRRASAIVDIVGVRR